MLKEIIINAVLNGGITYDYTNERSVHSGYAVSIYPKCERSLKVLSEKYLIHFIHENYDLLLITGNCIGIWEHNGYYYLDIVSVQEGRYRAMQLGKLHLQTAIYDLDTKQEIYL